MPDQPSNFSPLTVRIPLKGTVLFRVDGTDTLYEIGEVTYEANVDVQFTQSNITPTTFRHGKGA